VNFRYYPGRRVVTTSRDIATAVDLPTDGLISYWTLDEATGTRVDSHGTNPLTPINAPIGAAGKVGNGVDLETGSSQYLSYDDPAPVNNDDFTYALWFKRETFGMPRSCLVGKDNNVSRHYMLEINNIGDCTFSYLAATKIVSPATIVNNTNWHFVVFWHVAATKTIAIQLDNATPVTAVYTTYTPPASNIPVRIGARQATSLEGYFDGLIDEVGVWRRVLTPAERTLLWNNGDGVTYATVMDVKLTNADRTVLTPYTFPGEDLPFRIEVDPALYYHTGSYYEHVATDASGIWIYAPTR
jgi:hypothetical protein